MESNTQPLQWTAPPGIVDIAKVDFNSLGVSGLKQSHGVVMEDPLRQLQGRRGREVFKEMAYNDDVVGAVLMAITMLVRQVPWYEEPHDADDPASVQDAEFLHSVREDMSHSWTNFVAATMSMLPFGWAYFETIYKRRRGVVAGQPGESSRYTDGKIGIRKLALRRQDTLERWVFDEDGGLQGMVQMYEGVRYGIPIDRALLFQFGSDKQNPEGTSALRNAWRSWFFKKRIQEIEAIGIERNMAGMAIGWMPATMLGPNATAQDRANAEAFQDLLTNIRMDEQASVLMPLAYDEHGNKMYDLTLLKSGGEATYDTTGIVTRYDRAMASTMLADFILLGHEQAGSWALSSDKTELFGVALESILDDIASVLNRHWVPRLWAANGWQTNELPTLVHGKVEQKDIQQLANFIEVLARAGAPLFPDEALEAHLRTLANLPAPGATDI